MLDEVKIYDIALTAAEVLKLIGSGAPEGVHHCVNAGVVSRAGWARELLAGLGLRTDLVEVPASSWERASRPPRWGALEPTPLPSGEPMRDWREAFADAIPDLVRSLNRA